MSGDDKMETLQGKGAQIAISGFLTLIVYYFNIVAVPIIVLAIAMVIDYITGMISAWHNTKLSSKKGIFGIIKKVGYLVLVIIGMVVDWSVMYWLASFGALVTFWLIINELISILENLGAIGVQLPKLLLTIL